MLSISDFRSAYFRVASCTSSQEASRSKTDPGMASRTRLTLSSSDSLLTVNLDSATLNHARGFAAEKDGKAGETVRFRFSVIVGWYLVPDRVVEVDSFFICSMRVERGVTNM